MAAGIIIAFFVSFFWSFVGSIPPGTINLTVMQLGLDGKIKLAQRLALGAAIIEYPYAWIAVKFESIITTSPVVIANFQLITAVVMTTLGLLNVWSSLKPPTNITRKFNESGFKRGLVLGILNPLAMPFWIAITAYMRSINWIELSSPVELHSYLLGVSLGGFSLLILLAVVAKRIGIFFQEKTIIKMFPGIIMVALGLWSLIQYLFLK